MSSGGRDLRNTLTVVEVLAAKPAGFRCFRPSARSSRAAFSAPIHTLGIAVAESSLAGAAFLAFLAHGLVGRCLKQSGAIGIPPASLRRLLT